MGREIKTDLVIIGDGQLAFLTGLTAREMGYPLTIGVVGSDQNNSGGRIADIFYQGDIQNVQDLEIPLAQSLAVALDTEHVAVGPFNGVDNNQYNLFPSRGLSIVQNKRDQHKLLTESGVSMPAMRLIDSPEDYEKAVEEFNYRAVLQTGEGAYDGRGNAFIRGSDTVQTAWDKLGQRGSLFLEEMVNFSDEYAIQMVRGRNGEVLFFPLVRSVHNDGQLYFAESFKDTDFNLQQSAEQIGLQVSGVFPGKGLLTVELFKKGAEDFDLDENPFLVNEVTIDRPHNSGHHGMDGLTISQFDAICLLASRKSIRKPTFKPWVNYSAMVNLLGVVSSSRREIEGLDEVTDQTNVRVYWYGKSPREGRKLGHINFTGQSREEGIDKLLQALEMLNEFNGNIFQDHPNLLR